MTALFFCPESEQMCGAHLHRGAPADCGIPHLLRCDCLECLPGWPQAALPVLQDSTRLLPAPRYAAERLKEEARAQRWRKGPGRQRYLASQRRQNQLSGLCK